MKKNIGKQKAQITFINLLIILMIMFLFLAFLPIIISFINNYAVLAINGDGTPEHPGFNADQPTKDLLLAVIQLFPIGLAIMILASGLFYAIPRTENR